MFTYNGLQRQKKSERNCVKHIRFASTISIIRLGFKKNSSSVKLNEKLSKTVTTKKKDRN